VTTDALSSGFRPLARLGSVPQGSEQSLRFVQQRVALFGLVIFAISGGFFVVTATLGQLLPQAAPTNALIARAWHLVGTLLSGSLWLIARQPRTLGLHAIHILDALGLLSVCWVFGVMGLAFGEMHGFVPAVLAIVHVTIGRAVLIPSTAKRSLLLTAAAFAPLPVAHWLFPHVAYGGTTGLERIGGTIDLLMWATAATTLATITSSVIYGLHERVREARQLGQYTLEAPIGAGGMGEVYIARHALLRRPTAVKLVLGPDATEAQLRRFEREVQLTSCLTHPNTINVYDYGRTPDGIFYYAMEYLDGIDLEELVDRHGPQPSGRVIDILLQVCGALHEAHSVELIHRDVKPANIFLCERGGIWDFVKVLDFGLVKQVGAAPTLSQSSTNVLAGTPLYLSPEGITDPEKVDARSDLYALGAVAYYLLTGVPVFEGRTLVEICSHHLHTPPVPPSERAPSRSIDPELERIVLACLAKAPEDRPASAAALAEWLRTCTAHGSWTQEDAAEWWRLWLCARAKPAGGGDCPPVRTLTVDLLQRRTAPLVGGRPPAAGDRRNDNDTVKALNAPF